jgi:NUDIX domain
LQDDLASHKQSFTDCTNQLYIHTTPFPPFPFPITSDMDRTALSSNIRHLQSILKYVAANPSSEISNPPNCRKRASVALIIRVKPHPAHWPPEEPHRSSPDYSRRSATPTSDPLDEFFSLPWVQNGDPEILFIKRATRTRDRWGGHIALPGGRRDPGDESDRAAAVRETWEEVGIDLSPKNCISVGNLPERVVSTSWGKVP